jgi:hypothetical protein
MRRNRYSEEEEKEKKEEKTRSKKPVRSIGMQSERMERSNGMEWVQRLFPQVTFQTENRTQLIINIILRYSFNIK